MTIGVLKLVGNFLYLIGALMIAIPIIAFFATAGMIMLAGYALILTPVAGIVLVRLGKGMLRTAQKLEEDQANDKLMSDYLRDTKSKSNQIPKHPS